MLCNSRVPGGSLGEASTHRSMSKGHVSPASAWEKHSPTVLSFPPAGASGCEVIAVRPALAGCLGHRTYLPEPRVSTDGKGSSWGGCTHHEWAHLLLRGARVTLVDWLQEMLSRGPRTGSASSQMKHAVCRCCLQPLCSGVLSPDTVCLLPPKGKRAGTVSHTLPLLFPSKTTLDKSSPPRTCTGLP